MGKFTKIFIVTFIVTMPVIGMIPVSGSAEGYLPVLVEGRQWIEADSNPFADPPYVIDKWNQRTLCKDTLIDGKQWFPMSDCFSQVRDEFPDKKSIYFYFHEDNGVVYGVFGENGCLDFSTYGPDMDMNLKVGDRFLLSKVVKVDSIKVRGVVRKRITLECSEDLDSEAFFVEGIGMSSTAYASYMPGRTNRYLLWLKDKDGNIIFTQEDFRAPSYPEKSGIEKIHNDSEAEDRIYDLYGNPVANPIPGTIYIRRGRKFVQTGS